MTDQSCVLYHLERKELIWLQLCFEPHFYKSANQEPDLFLV